MDGSLHDSPAEVVLLVASWFVLVLLGRTVVRFDEKRLPTAALARAWPETSRDNALIGLPLLASPLVGLFAVAFHFARTRRFRPAGLALGVVAALAILAIDLALISALAWVLGVS